MEKKNHLTVLKKIRLNSGRLLETADEKGSGDLLGFPRDSLDF